jgi:hypothetical protein
MTHTPDLTRALSWKRCSLTSRDSYSGIFLAYDTSLPMSILARDPLQPRTPATLWFFREEGQAFFRMSRSRLVVAS